ncbi:acid phosphatase 1 [Artemisia annua]|uniref:Acid phosphatase 1 n=1 Tax=Artemisia annua TaxID=35608 RepID=A0A2U1LP35_ARTAN|nr:acid phosphatase 1 [Artemisia annua]
MEPSYWFITIYIKRHLIRRCSMNSNPVWASRFFFGLFSGPFLIQQHWSINGCFAPIRLCDKKERFQMILKLTSSPHAYHKVLGLLVYQGCCLQFGGDQSRMGLLCLFKVGLVYGKVKLCRKMVYGRFEFRLRFMLICDGAINFGDKGTVFEMYNVIIVTPELKEERQVDNVFSINAEDTIHALAEVDQASAQGTKPEGSIWWKETGTEVRPNRVVLQVHVAEMSGFGGLKWVSLGAEMGMGFEDETGRVAGCPFVFLLQLHVTEKHEHITLLTYNNNCNKKTKCGKEKKSSRLFGELSTPLKRQGPHGPKEAKQLKNGVYVKVKLVSERSHFISANKHFVVLLLHGLLEKKDTDSSKIVQICERRQRRVTQGLAHSDINPDHQLPRTLIIDLPQNLDHGTDSLREEVRVRCRSWRVAVEANNLSPWKTIPEECVDYVKEYMLGPSYEIDLEMVSNEAAEFARSVALKGDGMDAWVFDVDETLLSNLPYYAQHGYGFYAFKTFLRLYASKMICLTFAHMFSSKKVHHPNLLVYGCHRSEIFDHVEFDKWVLEGVAPAIKPSLDLYNEVLRLGFRLVLLTGRAEDKRTITINNLTMAGFRNWDKLILRVDEDHGKTAVAFKSNKRKEITEEGFRLIGNSGDQWSDLTGSSVAVRSFKLSNPMYFIS